MTPNFLVIAATSFIPFFVAYLWFHPNVFGGDTWKKLAGLSDDCGDISPAKLGLSILLNFLVAYGLCAVCIHQLGVFGMVGGDFEALSSGTAKAFLDEYGQNHLSFGHGMLHAVFPTALAFVLPVVGYAAIFEHKSMKYLLVNLGFWIISMMLMAGVICQWGWTIA